MNRRQLLGASAALALASSARALHAQDSLADLMSAPKILDALTAKDIVIDRPAARYAPRGADHARPAAPRAVHLHVAFDFDSARLLTPGRAQLDQLALALSHRALQRTGFVLAAHTDHVGAPDYNVMLSLARAEAVKTYLVVQHGLPAHRLQTLGYGYSRLLDPLHPASPVNRRVEVRALRVDPAASASSTGRLVTTPGEGRE